MHFPIYLRIYLLKNCINSICGVHNFSSAGDIVSFSVDGDVGTSGVFSVFSDVNSAELDN